MGQISILEDLQDRLIEDLYDFWWTKSSLKHEAPKISESAVRKTIERVVGQAFQKLNKYDGAGDRATLILRFDAERKLLIDEIASMRDALDLSASEKSALSVETRKRIDRARLSARKFAERQKKSIDRRQASTVADLKQICERQHRQIVALKAELRELKRGLSSPYLDEIEQLKADKQMLQHQVSVIKRKLEAQTRSANTRTVLVTKNGKAKRNTSGEESSASGKA